MIVFLLTVLLGSLLVYSLRQTQNGLEEFCTTKAFGWPFAWQIDNCECDGRGGLTEFPSSALAMNSGAVLAFGVVTASLFSFFSWLQKDKSRTTKAEQDAASNGDKPPI